MTPLQFAKRECANFMNDGGCLGVRADDLIDNNGPWRKRTGDQVKSLRPKQQCNLCKSGNRCAYFEEVVLPLAERRLPKNQTRLKIQMQKARETYLIQNELMSKKKKERFCECGKPIEKRQRYCSSCTAEKRRETKRKAQDKWRAK
jgi:hypothetical protein